MPVTPIQASDAITVPYSAAVVWPLLADFAGYGEWWPQSLGFRILSDGENLLGTEVEIHPSGGRPFQCRVEAVEVPQRLVMRYFGGFITGTGEWLLEPVGSATRVTYRLDVQARGWLVALLGKVFDLGRLHSRSMQTVLHNLDQLLSRQQPLSTAL